MDKPGIVITGVSGRMGQMLVRLVSESDKVRLVGAVERPGSPWIGQDLGAAMGGQPNGVIVTDDAVGAIAKAQAVIDFHGRGAIEYIAFPAHLQGAYQSFTEANMSALREAGYDAPFLSVQDGVARYLAWLMAH